MVNKRVFKNCNAGYLIFPAYFLYYLYNYVDLIELCLPLYFLYIYADYKQLSSEPSSFCSASLPFRLN